LAGRAIETWLIIKTPIENLSLIFYNCDMKREWKEYNFWVYIMFNERAKATYIGMTNDLRRRVYEHKNGIIPGHSKEKGTNKLGYFEYYKYANMAIAREKELKEWHRAWKYRLLETMNPDWKDLSEGF
jgi:putative endonuclease